MITWAFAWLLVKLQNKGFDKAFIAGGLWIQFVISVFELFIMFLIVWMLTK